MADTPKKVVRLADNIKLELYESGRKKYVQIWDPTGNNTYNEGDGGPSGIKSPERSKKYSSADEDDYVIHNVIEYYSQIVGYYYGKSNRSAIKEYFNYLQDPFSETPPPKRIYGGGGLGTPEVDNVGPTPYYLNNGCKVNIKWTGQVPNPDFNRGTFSTPEEAENYNDFLPKASKGPARWLLDKPILSDEDESNVNNNTTLRPQSEWVLENGGYYPGDDNNAAITYSVGYRDKPIVNDKFVSITLPTGFTENGGKGYLEWVGQGEGKGLIYSTAPKGTISESRGVNSRGEGVGEEVDIKVKGNFSKDAKDTDILNTIIEAYKKQVGKVYIIDYKDYDLKVCFPDTGTCSPIPYKSPLSKEEAPGATPSAIVPVVPLLPKKVKLNVFGLPGVTSLSGETDGTIKVKVKVSLPDFTVYLGDPPGATNSNASGLNPFGLVEDDVENPDPYEEGAFAGQEEEIQKAINIELSKGQESLKNINTDTDNNTSGGGGEKQPQGNGNTGKNGDPYGSNPSVIQTTATGKIKKMLEIAKGEIGYKEVFNQSLYIEEVGKSPGPAVAGRPGKDTKFGVYWGINGHHYCGMFVNWCAEMAGMKKGVKGKTTSYNSVPDSIYCPNGVNMSKDKGAYASNGSNKAERSSSKVIPEPGDIVYFSWNGDGMANHVGIVVKDDGNSVVCIEGNTLPGNNGANQKGAGVWERTRHKSLILGYCRIRVYEASNSDPFVGPTGKAGTEAKKAGKPFV
jgi:hypothetical protein